MVYMKEYPRPDFQRASELLKWESLEGPWDFQYDDNDEGLAGQWHIKGIPDTTTTTTTTTTSSSTATKKTYSKRPIQVPFAFQTPASGIGERDAHEVLWYEREISDIRTPDEKKASHRLMLRFGAVDYDATIWVDGQRFAEHRGGHVPFDVDITDAFAVDHGKAKAKAKLIVRVCDSPYDLTQPRGKQYWGPEPESIFYTPTSGIWQSVWLESVPPMRLGSGSDGTVFLTNAIKTGDMHAEVAVLGRRAGAPCSVEVSATLGGVPVGNSKGDLPKDKNFAKVSLNLRMAAESLDTLGVAVWETSPLENKDCWREGLALWSPEHPALYDLVIRLFDAEGRVVDEVNTQAGMRSLDWTSGDRTFRLNGKPYFQILCLDQGYWPETGMTPPSQDSLKADVELAKKMGFNGCRKHQKVEDPLFLYWADKLGYLVWGEMANAYEFDAEYVDRFNQEWLDSMRRDMNHPCIVAWTPVNESWGYKNLRDSVPERNHIRALYYLTKTLDPTRPVNDNCGWESVLTDLTTFHDYADAPELGKTCATMEGILGPKADRPMFVGPIHDKLLVDPRAEVTPGAPVLCTEFGGVNIAPAAKDAAVTKDWGYTTASDPEDLLRRIENLVMAVVKGGHCCGFVYTQLTDIEQEVNGLCSFDRREKIDASRVRAIFESASKIYHEKLAAF